MISSLSMVVMPEIGLVECAALSERIGTIYFLYFFLSELVLGGPGGLLGILFY